MNKQRGDSSIGLAVVISLVILFIVFVWSLKPNVVINPDDLQTLISRSGHPQELAKCLIPINEKNHVLTIGDFTSCEEKIADEIRHKNDAGSSVVANQILKKEADGK